MVDGDDNEDGDDDGEEEEGDDIDHGGVGTGVGWEGVIAANVI